MTTLAFTTKLVPAVTKQPLNLTAGAKGGNKTAQPSTTANVADAKDAKVTLTTPTTFKKTATITGVRAHCAVTQLPELPTYGIGQ